MPADTAELCTGDIKAGIPVTRAEMQGQSVRIEHGRAAAVIARQPDVAAPPGIILECTKADKSHAASIRTQREHSTEECCNLRVKVRREISFACWHWFA